MPFYPYPSEGLPASAGQPQQRPWHRLEQTAMGRWCLTIRFREEVNERSIYELRDWLQQTDGPLQQLDNSEKVTVCFDFGDFDFMNVQTRQALVECLRQFGTQYPVVMLSQQRWMHSYWHLLQRMIPDLELKTAHSAEEVQELLAAHNDKNRTRNEQKTAFEKEWQTELHTHYFDRYLLKCVHRPEWTLHMEQPQCVVKFYWIETNVLYVELQGELSTAHLNQYLQRKRAAIAYLADNNVKHLKVMLNIQQLNQRKWIQLSALKAHIAQLPIPVERYLIARSVVDTYVHRLIGWVYRDIQLKGTFQSIHSALRHIKGQSHASPKTLNSGKGALKYSQHLEKKQRLLYQRDEQFRRQLFGKLSQLLEGKADTSTPKRWNVYMEAEIAQAVELLTADFRKVTSGFEQHTRQMQQMQSLAKQHLFNPHFVFNSLNAILSSLYANDLRTSEQLLTTFAHLMRKVLEQATERHISLADELEFLEKYLEMEQIRASQQFSVQLELQPELRAKAHQVSIAPMLIQPFVEQAIWSRLMPQQGAKHLHIQFEQLDNYLLCTIEDSGIGLLAAKAARNGQSDTQSTRSARERISALNALGEETIKVYAQDVVDETRLVGSQVSLFFPNK